MAIKFLIIPSFFYSLLPANMKILRLVTQSCFSANSFYLEVNKKTEEKLVISKKLPVKKIYQSLLIIQKKLTLSQLIIAFPQHSNMKKKP